MASDRAPVYLSPRSADVILSEIRPTRLKADALQSINAFLDELLFLVVQSARSFAPLKLKDSLLKLLPTPLGKEAILEAELELRNSRERSNPTTSPVSDEVTPKDFPIQAAFELLRLKCEACTTLNEVDEDADAEARLIAKLAGALSLRSNVIPTAVLYMTAILEYLCQHILSSVGRVVTRDSSRTVAHAHDLYIALCEDETIYSLFTNMKVFETINTQSSLVKPRRSKSFSQSVDFSSPTSRTSSPTSHPGSPEMRSSRPSDSAASRTSFEKARALRIFKGGVNHENGSTGDVSSRPPLPHVRTQSQTSNSRQASSAYEDETDNSSPISQNFDELMLSGQTMKFSLTPDRLQSMEAFKQKAQRVNNVQTNTSVRNGTTSPRDELSPPTSPQTRVVNGRKPRNQVESIDEGEEEAPSGPTVPLVNGGVNGKTAAPSSGSAVSSSPTSMSRSTSAQWVVPPARTRSKIESSDLTGHSVPSERETKNTKHSDNAAGMANRTRITRNRESLDLDDIMNGADEIDSKPQLIPKTATSVRNDTRDFVDFLAGGPPEDFTSSRSVTSQVESARKSSGRFRSMVFKLRSRPSTDRLPRDDELGLVKSTLSTKSSVSDIQVQNYPRPPRYNQVSSPPSAFTKPELLKETQSLPPRKRATSMPRKAVPEWTDGTEDEEEADRPPHIPVDIAKSVRSTATTAKQNLAVSSSPVVSAETKGRPEVKSLTTSVAQAPPTATSRVASTLILNGSLNPNSSAPKPQPKAASQINKGTAEDLRKMLIRAESASECRILVDMFLTQAGVPTSTSNARLYTDRAVVPDSLVSIDNEGVKTMELLLSA